MEREGLKREQRNSSWRHYKVFTEKVSVSWLMSLGNRRNQKYILSRGNGLWIWSLSHCRFKHLHKVTVCCLLGHKGSEKNYFQSRSNWGVTLLQKFPALPLAGKLFIVLWLAAQVRDKEACTHSKPWVNE